MTDAWARAMVTGHRPQHLRPDSIEWIGGELDRIAVKLAAEHGTGLLISGMALGVDQMWARTAQRAPLPLAAYVPFPQQPDVWWRWPHLVAGYRELLAYARSTGGVHTTGDLAGVDDPDRRKALASQLLHDRNDDMLAAADVVIAVIRTSRLAGGTRSAYRKARDAGVPLIRVDPDRRTATRADLTPPPAPAGGHPSPRRPA